MLDLINVITYKKINILCKYHFENNSVLKYQNKLMIKFILTALLFAGTTSLMAQSTIEEDQNVVISKSKKEFKFVKGDSENPVQIKEENRRTYTCNNYRT